MHDAIGQSSNLKIENHGPDLSFNAQAPLAGWRAIDLCLVKY
jgi:hypothetical protein